MFSFPWSCGTAEALSPIRFKVCRFAESRVNSVNLDDQEQPSAQATESVADVADTDREPPVADSSAACNGIDSVLHQ